VHAEGFKSLHENQKMSFEVKQGSKGKQAAVSVSTSAVAAEKARTVALPNAFAAMIRAPHQSAVIQAARFASGTSTRRPVRTS
jgi:ribonucleotide reductase beta subunit family protein with ferritin-like domain